MTTQLTVGLYGWELSANMGLKTIVNTTRYSRDTAVFSPRGGVASIKGDQSVANVSSVEVLNQADFATALTVITTPSANRLAITFDFRTDGIPATKPAFVCCFAMGNAPPVDYLNLCVDTTGKLHWYQKASGAIGAGEGTSVGSAGSFVLAANTWYRMYVWIDATGLTTFSVSCAIGAIDTDGLTPDATASGTLGSSASSFNPCLGGLVDAVTAPGVHCYYDNLIYWLDAQQGDHNLFDGVVLSATATADGTDIDYNVTNTGVDAAPNARTKAVGNLGATLEPPENGSGTTDADYVSWATAAAKNQTFAVTPSYPSPKWFNPVGWVQSIWHRNASGKWSSVFFRGYFQTVNRSTLSSYPDPGTSYINGAGMRRFGSDTSNANKLTMEDIAAMEMGFSRDSTNANDHRVSTIAMEIGYSRKQGSASPCGMGVGIF